MFYNKLSVISEVAKFGRNEPFGNVSFFVTRLFQTEGVTPEIIAVSEFIASILGEDCAGEKDLTFLTLRVSVHLD